MMMNMNEHLPYWFRYCKYAGVYPQYDFEKRIIRCSRTRKWVVTIICVLMIPCLVVAQLKKSEYKEAFTIPVFTEICADVLILIFFVRILLKNVFSNEMEWMRLFEIFNFHVLQEKYWTRVCHLLFTVGHVLFILNFSFECFCFLTLYGLMIYLPYFYSIIHYYCALLVTIGLFNFMCLINNGYMLINNTLEKPLICSKEVKTIKHFYGKLNTFVIDINKLFEWDLFLLIIFTGLQMVTCLYYCAFDFVRIKSPNYYGFFTTFFTNLVFLVSDGTNF